jgi:hypothetical protein
MCDSWPREGKRRKGKEMVQNVEIHAFGNQHLREGRTQTPGPKFLVVIESFSVRNLRSVVSETALFS